MTTKNGPPRTGDPGGPESETTTAIDGTRESTYRAARPPATSTRAAQQLPRTPFALRAFVVDVIVAANRHLPAEAIDLVPELLEAIGLIIVQQICEPDDLEARMLAVLRERWMFAHATGQA